MASSFKVTYAVRGPVDNAELTVLHGRAFGVEHQRAIPWTDRLERHSLTWVTAYVEGRLVGFVNLIGDGRAHAVLLDLVVDSDLQGRTLFGLAVDAARDAGCYWLHVDYAEGLADFYQRVCAVVPSRAGLIPLR